MSGVRVAAARADEYSRLLIEAGLAVNADDADVALADPRRFAELDFSRLGWVQSTWAGVDAVPWHLVPSDTVVTALPGVFGPQMSEFVFGHLLARTQRIPQRYATRHWDETLPTLLDGSTLGVLGAGSIGASIAETARHFGMSVRGCRRTGADDPRYDAMFPIDRVAEFADGLDHLVAVLPATDETVGLIDGELLGRLRSGATFINIGRGVTAVTDEVIESVRGGAVGLAILDVTDPEPLPSDHPAWETPGVVITGHTAAHSRPADVVGFLLDNLVRYRRGAALRGVVDRERGY